MLVPTRLITIAVATLAVSGCERSVDVNLIGKWRAEDKSSIREVAFRQDHGLSTYYRYKPAPDELAALTNPSLPEDTGEWQLQGYRLAMTFKETNGARLPTSTSLIIVKLGKTDLVLKRDGVANQKEFDYFGDALSFTRLGIAGCKSGLAINDPGVSANKIIGNWRVHYRTHDCRYLYKDDYSLKSSSMAKESLGPSCSARGALIARLLSTTYDHRVPQSQDNRSGQ